MPADTAFAIGTHTIGEGRCFIIAEAGVNHNGDLALAHKLIDTAVEANQRCTQTTQKHCSADQDLAHKIAVEIKKNHLALITNLSAMR